MTPDLEYMVCVSCKTYNHAEYITDAMNGFCMQDTNFPFVCTIVDDASTDREQEVICAYLNENFDQTNDFYKEEDNINFHMIFAQHKSNKNCYFAVYLLKENHYGKKDKNIYIQHLRDRSKYIAFCEGDDYWTDSHKLQKQYDALESNPDCTICVAREEVIDSKKNSLNIFIPPKLWNYSNYITLKDLLDSEFYNGIWTFQTASFFMRRDIVIKSLQLCKSLFKDFPYTDMPFLLTALLNGDAYFIEDVVGVYRSFSGGYNSSLLKDTNKNINIELKLIKAFKAFDQYTNFVYHKEMEMRILRCKFKIAKLKKSIRLFLNKELFPLYKLMGAKLTLLIIVPILYPKLYNFTTKIKHLVR